MHTQPKKLSPAEATVFLNEELERLLRTGRFALSIVLPKEHPGGKVLPEAIEKQFSILDYDLDRTRGYASVRLSAEINEFPVAKRYLDVQGYSKRNACDAQNDRVALSVALTNALDRAGEMFSLETPVTKRVTLEVTGTKQDVEGLLEDIKERGSIEVHNLNSKTLSKR